MIDRRQLFEVFIVVTVIFFDIFFSLRVSSSTTSGWSVVGVPTRHSWMLPYSRGLQSLGHRPVAVLVTGLLGTRPYSRSWGASKQVKPLPITPVLPKLGLLSDQWWQCILIGVQTPLWTVYMRDWGCVLLMRIILKPTPTPALIPSPWKKNHHPWNWLLVPKRLGTAATGTRVFFFFLIILLGCNLP